MTSQATTHDPHPAHGHDDPMSHVPPGSIWPLLVAIGLILMSFGGLALMANNAFVFGSGAMSVTLSHGFGKVSLAIGTLIMLYCLMGWCHQVIVEKAISHDLAAQQHDLKHFMLLFLTGELAVFGAIFAYFYHRKIWDPTYGPVEGMELGGWKPAVATFILISSSVTCEMAHHAVEHGRRSFGKALLLTTIVLGTVFLGFQGYEYGELIQRGFSPIGLGGNPAASFASLFFCGTGFHGLHVAIGLVMLFMVLLRLEAGHFRGTRSFAITAASWYWHFVDIVWILLFITVYVVA